MRLVPVLLALAFSAQPLLARELTGSLAYLTRIALPPSALVAVEISGISGPVAARRDLSRGAQVPLPFTLTDPTGDTLTLRAAIFIDGRPIWTSDALTIPAGNDDLDLGTLRLDPVLALGFPTRLDCKGQTVDLHIDAKTALMRFAGHTVTLATAPSAQGLRFTDGETPETGLRLQQDRIGVTLAGRTLPDCTALIPQNLLPFRANGTEPFWSLSITRDGLRLEKPDAAPVEAPLPPAESTTATLTFRDDALTATLQDKPCRNDMTGMLFPASVTVETGGQTLQGCGGDPATLLDGAWQTLELDGKPLRGGASLLFTFQGGRISGTACNRFSGGVTLTAEGLSFGSMAATRMACPATQMQAETAAFAAFAATTGFDIDDQGRLLLTGPSGPLLVATR